ncbi:uncharacterized protein [Watersipora subatra]|uniref:uncharacterized protein n=1 Tax=Watersipora subatra TaxID=2589382 RepID=UPI00355BB2F3
MEAMNDELLIAKFSGYECDIRNYLQLIHLFKDDNGKSRRKIVADIEAASEKAISSLKCLQSELIDDTIYLFNQQLKDYELYEDELNERFSEVRENVKKAYGMSQEAKNAAAIKLNKAIYALEPPKEKVVSFLDLHTNLAKSSIGVVISDTAHTLKSIPFDRKPLKKKLRCSNHHTTQSPYHYSEVL